MINSYNDKLQYRDSEIIILGCPKINNLFILILIPRLKLLCLSSLFERYRRINQVLEAPFLKEMLNRNFTATLALSVDLQRDRGGRPLRKTHWPVVAAVGTRFWTFFHGLSFFGNAQPRFQPLQGKKNAWAIEMSVQKLNLGRPLS